MRSRPFILASTLAAALCLAAAAPAKAQFYPGGSFVSVGGPGGYFSFGSGSMVGAPMVGAPMVAPMTTVVSPMTAAYPYYVPTSRVVVQPSPLMGVSPYGGMYRSGWGWGPRPMVYGPRVYSPRVYTRRGWW